MSSRNSGWYCHQCHRPIHGSRGCSTNPRCLICNDGLVEERGPESHSHGRNPSNSSDDSEEECNMTYSLRMFQPDIPRAHMPSTIFPTGSPFIPHGHRGPPPASRASVDALESVRISCPVRRDEMPTDDPVYDQMRVAAADRGGARGSSGSAAPGASSSVAERENRATKATVEAAAKVARSKVEGEASHEDELSEAMEILRQLKEGLLHPDGGDFDDLFDATQLEREQKEREAWEAEEATKRATEEEERAVVEAVVQAAAEAVATEVKALEVKIFGHVGHEDRPHAKGDDFDLILDDEQFGEPPALMTEGLLASEVLTFVPSTLMYRMNPWVEAPDKFTFMAGIAEDMINRLEQIDPIFGAKFRWDPNVVGSVDALLELPLELELVLREIYNETVDCAWSCAKFL